MDTEETQALQKLLGDLIDIETAIRDGRYVHAGMDCTQLRHMLIHFIDQRRSE